MDARKVVAWNLRRLRVEKGLSQESLAVDAEIDRTYVSRLERNMENPTVGVLERLAAALDVEIVAFFTKLDPRAPAPRPLRSGRRPKTSSRRV
jgi:transcriptional regulator with XRE-family HTH domain